MECPKCGSEEVKSDNNIIEGATCYLCENPLCRHGWRVINAKELTTAKKLLWLVEKYSIDTHNCMAFKQIKLWVNGHALQFNAGTFAKAINAAYDFAIKEAQNAASKGK